MESNAIIGLGVLFFIFILFSWSLGRFINKRKQKESNEFQNLITGAWILGLIITLMVGVNYYYKHF